MITRGGARMPGHRLRVPSIGSHLRRRIALVRVRRDPLRHLRRTIGLSTGDLAAFNDEIRRSGLLEHLDEAAEEFRASVRGTTVRGNPYSMGAVDLVDGLCLYSIVRAARPRTLVETGVCNGFSTAFILLGLAANGSGELFSVDLPEVAGDASPGVFWGGKRGAVIPAGKEPGWVIPPHLRRRWDLILGRSQDRLPELLSRLRSLDLFMHDSEHSYECMSFEFSHAYRALATGGILAADDVFKNTAFFDFARLAGRRPVPFGSGMALIVR